MIARYILHIEIHKGYRPRISFKRAPEHGDRVVDGGIPGTLKRCPNCQDGFLHEPDRLSGVFPLAPDEIVVSLDDDDKTEYKLDQVVRKGAFYYRVYGVGQFPDGTKRTVYLRKERNTLVGN